MVVQAHDLHKAFDVPDHRVDSLKERVVHPLRRIESRRLEALKGVSFEVHQGEFFGIVGRNGSGKSTLLKVMASIYGLDSGRLRVAGRLAPFIELGVGFNPELAARENVILNGVLMGLTRREARRRFDSVLDFSELREFADLKLKNYSSGMMVRLAFAVMVEADADVLLVDEVLAVGDAAFARRCMDVFKARRAAGTTIILVTHDMETVQSMCDRAMVLERGEVRHTGAPDEAAARYLRMNFSRPRADGSEPEGIISDVNVRIVRSQLLDGAGAPLATLAPGEPLRLDVVLEAAQELLAPNFVVQVRAEDGANVFAFLREAGTDAAEGSHVTLGGEVQHRLAPGRYHLDCWVRRQRPGKENAVQGLRLLSFAVDGPTEDVSGMMRVDADVQARVSA